jgi:hypothetical protein
MYFGEAVRPNTLLWLLTINGLSASKDVAQRSVIVHLKRPVYSETWERDARNYICEHRWAIIADLKTFLLRPRVALTRFTRWSEWEADVLSRLPDPHAAQQLISDRQQVADVGDDEGAVIEDYFRQQLARCHYKLDEKSPGEGKLDDVHIPSVIAMDWMSCALGERVHAKAMSHLVDRYSQDGTFTHLRKNLSRTVSRGLLWYSGGKVRYDLEERLARVAMTEGNRTPIKLRGHKR